MARREAPGGGAGRRGAALTARSPAEASRAFAAAITAGDVEAALACWAPDAVIVAADGAQARGHAALRGRFAALVAAGVAVDVEVDELVEAEAVALARTRMVMRAGAAAPPLAVGATIVYRREADGGWRLVLDRIDPAG